jgi:hypothetical protein
MESIGEGEGEKKKVSHPSFMHPTANGVMRAWVLTMAMGDEDDGFDVYDDDGEALPAGAALIHQLYFLSAQPSPILHEPTLESAHLYPLVANENSSNSPNCQFPADAR